MKPLGARFGPCRKCKAAHEDCVSGEILSADHHFCCDDCYHLRLDTRGVDANPAADSQSGMTE